MRSIYSFFLTFLLVAACMGACSSCLHRVAKTPVPHQASEAQRFASVQIQMICGYKGQVRQWAGTGTIVAKHKVLTADHVTDCPGNSAIFVKTHDGTLLLAKVLQADPKHDVSMLSVEQALPTVPRPRVGRKPATGDVICYEASTPRRSRKCGTVWMVTKISDNDIAHDADTEGGNSGAGVYNAGGELVGVVTRRNRTSTQGGVASLWHLRKSFGL